MATFYILHSKSIDRNYIGSCLVLEKRISEHNGSQTGARRLTRMPIALVCC